MPEEEEVTEEEQEEGVKLSKDELSALYLQAARGMAISLGFDMDNPATDLVIEKFWTPEIELERFKELGEKYGVIVKEKKGPFPAKPGPEGEAGASELLDSLDTSTVQIEPQEEKDPEERARTIMQNVMKKGGRQRDAHAAILEDLFRSQGNPQARDRIAARNGQ